METQPESLPRFIEIDGTIPSNGVIPGMIDGMGGLMGMILGGMNTKKQGEKFTPCKKWIRVSRFEDIEYHDSPIELRRPVVANNSNEPAEDETSDTPEFAPAGWWVSINSHRCHVADHQAEAMERIVTQPQTDRVAQALYRLAEEIALKPANQNGSLVESFASHFDQLSGSKTE